MALSFSKINWHGRIFRYVPLFVVIAMILFASTTQASMSKTSRIIRPLLEFLFPQTPEPTLVIYHGYIRKFAHFAEYAVLGFFASRAFWHSKKKSLRENWYLAAFALVLIVASFDELNQSFNPSRTGSVNDVLLDCFGGAFLIGSLMFYKKIGND
ncbi:MAG: VanZ family protein [Pyrinomonadaceae bacterium]|nr:VanZ family protein [Pyrinomonadaceae bacterium]